MIARIAALLFFASGLFVIGVQAPATAAVGCHNNGCTDKWPVRQNCADGARRISSASINTPYLPAAAQLIYSPACNAAWARGQSLNTGADHGADGSFDIRIAKKVSGEVVYRSTTNVKADMGRAWDWTKMAGLGNGQVRACVKWRTTWECTAWFKP